MQSHVSFIHSLIPCHRNPVSRNYFETHRYDRYTFQYMLGDLALPVAVHISCFAGLLLGFSSWSPFLQETPVQADLWNKVIHIWDISPGLATIWPWAIWRRWQGKDWVNLLYVISKHTRLYFPTSVQSLCSRYMEIVLATFRKLCRKCYKRGVFDGQNIKIFHHNVHIPLFNNI